MLVDVLGPLRMRGDLGDVPVPSGRPVTALAWLVLHRNDLVALETITSILWDRPPSSAGARTRSVIRSLADLVGHDRIELGRDRARLRVDADEVDAERFDRGLTRAATVRADGDELGAAQVLDDALALWRGTPYPELGHVVEAQGVAARLTDRWLAAREDRVALSLRGAVDYTLVAELRALVILHPERPRLRRQLAVALYRTDRQVEALDTVRGLRAELGDADGSTEQLQQAILQHDPALADGEIPTG